MIAIMSAMPEEMARLRGSLRGSKKYHHGMRDYYVGSLFGHRCVLVFSHWGKVAAATTATELISKYKVSEIIFTGVAGAIDSRLKIGDVVVGKTFVQHDLDTRPLFGLGEIPLLGITQIRSTPAIRLGLVRAAKKSLKESKDGPEVYLGQIATGDQFIRTAKQTRAIRSAFKGTLCVEMEGAAVAQVCHEYGVRFGVVRVISDEANHKSVIDFGRFIKETASEYSYQILQSYLGHSITVTAAAT